MKAKLTVTRRCLPIAKDARRRGVSLSEVIEERLRDLSAESGADALFASRWRGRFRPAGKREGGYELLAKKYL